MLVIRAWKLSSFHDTNLHYQLSEDGDQDRAAQFVSNLTTGVPLQQGTEYSVDVSQELIHI